MAAMVSQMHLMAKAMAPAAATPAARSVKRAAPEKAQAAQVATASASASAPPPPRPQRRAEPFPSKRQLAPAEHW